MEEQKSYVVVKPGTANSPHILANANDETDILALCACGCTKDPNRHCDGSHKTKDMSAETQGHGGCCGGGHCGA